MTDTRDYSKTGLNTLKAALKTRKTYGKVRLPITDKLDKRSPVARALMEWVSDVADTLGGNDYLTPQRRMILEILAKEKLFLNCLDTWLMEQRSLINFKKRSVLPVLTQRQTIADSMVRHLQVLGLDRTAKPIPDLQTYLAAKDARKALPPTTEEDSQ